MSTLYIRYPATSGGGGGTITDINGATGPSISILSGTGISVGTVGNNITITNTSPSSGGTVTSVSVVSTNGLAGTVATATTTPAITLSTTITGILQGNGTAISAATTGDLTDVGTDGIAITNGTGAVLGTGTSIAQQVSDATHNGYLSSVDWNTFNNKQDTGVGTANTFAGFDGTGLLESVPGFIIGAEGGMNESLLEHPNNVGGGFTANNFNVAFQPLQNSPDDDWNIQLINVNFDDAGSGFSQGTSGEAATLLNLNTNHGNTGPIGNVNMIKMYHGMGNGTDPLTINGLTYGLGFADINDNVTFNNNLQGFTFQPHMHSGAIPGATFNVQAFVDNAQLDAGVNSYTGFTSNPVISEVFNNSNYNAFIVNPNITTLTGNAGAFGYGFYPTIPTVGTTGQVIGINMNPTITTLGTNANYQAITAGGTVTTMGTSSNLNGFSWFPTVTTSHGTIQGLQINPTITGGDANFTGVNISPSGGATLTNPIGLQINLNNISTTDPQGLVGIQSDNRLQVNADTQFQSGQGFQTGTRIEHLFHVPLGSPVTGTDGIGLNFAGDFLAQDDVVNGAFGLGFAGMSAISSLAIAATKTVQQITGFISAVALPDPGFTTGGTITDLNMIHMIAPLPQGGTATITNIYGFKLDNFGGPFSAAATNAWGLFIEDTALQNHIGGILDVGSLELNGSTSGVMTINAAAVTTDYTVIAPAAQGTGALTNDGAGNLSWTTSSGGATTFFEDTSTTPQTVTLPAPTNGEMVIVKDISGNAQVNNITINPFAAELIDGMASLVITFNYGFVQLESNGTDWFVTARSNNISPWTLADSANFSNSGFGTPVTQNISTRRVGDTYEVKGTWVSGVVTPNDASIILPSNIAIDTTKLPSNVNGTLLGIALANQATPAPYFDNHDNDNSMAIFFDGSAVSEVFLTFQSNGNNFDKQHVDNFLGSGQALSFNFSIPVDGWGDY